MFCDCGAAGPVAPIEGEPGMARRDAIAAWNRRPAPMEAVAWREKVARLLCEQRGLDPDEHVIGGQATNFEDFGPRWQAARHGHFYGFHDYEEDADAILALIATHPVQGGEG